MATVFSILRLWAAEAPAGMSFHKSGSVLASATQEVEAKAIAKIHESRRILNRCSIGGLRSGHKLSRPLAGVTASRYCWRTSAEGFGIPSRFSAEECEQSRWIELTHASFENVVWVQALVNWLRSVADEKERQCDYEAEILTARRREAGRMSQKHERKRERAALIER